ncbi:unnamed protein product, partial [Didymodactylos carnosus]
LLTKGLEVYGLIELNKLNFISDRGSNFVAALRQFTPMYCFAHRLNNILKLSFYQQQKKEKATALALVAASSSLLATRNSDLTRLELEKTSSDSDGFDSDDDIPLNMYLSMSVKRDLKKNADITKKPIGELSHASLDFLRTINNCKSLVKYVKLNGLNKDIQDYGGVCLKQSTTVRWLSLINLLESIAKSYEQTKKVLAGKKQQNKFHIDKQNVQELIQLLKPFKRVITLIQKGCEPSLYMVLICVLKLRKTLRTSESLFKYNRQELDDKKQANQENNRDNRYNTDDLVEYESEGLSFFRTRTVQLLNLMFTLDIRHYTATLLHPRYRKLKTCSNLEIRNCHKYVRQQMALIQVDVDIPKAAIADG